MGRIIKLMALLAVLVIVVVIVSVLYVAAVAGVDIPVLAGVFRAEGEPISAEVIARGQAVERKIEEAVEDKLAFFLELTDEELTSLLLSKIDPDTQIRDARVTIKEGFVDISGSLNGRIGIPFGGSVDIALVAGDIDIAIRDISVGFLSLARGREGRASTPGRQGAGPEQVATGRRGDPDTAAYHGRWTCGYCRRPARRQNSFQRNR